MYTKEREHTNEEALACGDGVSTLGELIPLLLGILKEGLDLLILHGILDRPKQYTLLFGCANLDALGELYHALDELGVNGLVDVDTLGGNAHLTRIEESTHGDFGHSLVHVDIGKNDARIVSAKFESDTLKCLCASLHNLLSGGNGTSKGDLGDTRVGCEKRTKLVITSEDLDDAWRKDLLREFDEFEGSVWSERRWLHDDRTAFMSQ